MRANLVSTDSTEKTESEKAVEMKDNKHSGLESDCASSENSSCDQKKSPLRRQMTDMKALPLACHCDDSGCSTVHASTESLEPKKTPRQQMVDNLNALVQACQCDDAVCSVVACEKMKKLVNHSKECEDLVNGGCSRCKTLFVLCCYHARSCQLENCSVIHCTRIKAKMRHRRWVSFIFVFESFVHHLTLESFLSVTKDVAPAVIASLDTSIGKEYEISKQEVSDRIIEQNSDSLVHALQCNVRACAIPLCAKSKILISHAATCTRKAIGRCKHCIRVVKLINVHATNCQNGKCKIPLCLKLKVGNRSIQERWIFYTCTSGSWVNWNWLLFICRKAENMAKLLLNGAGVVKSSKLDALSQVRKNSVSRLVLTMCPSADLNAKLDEKTRCQFECAQTMEEGIFKRAKSHLEYQKLIVNTIRDVSEAKFLVEDD